MTGPPYPHPNPAPGSNAIGTFAIGISPIGDIPLFDIWDTIISQYANSPILDAIITSFSAAMDMTENFDNFFDLMWNVLTAQGYGLDVWGRIVGVTRSLPVTAPVSTATFGFNEPGNDWVGFGQAPFSSGASPTTNITLTDAQFRPVVLAKAATNVWNGSVPDWNQILQTLFLGRGQAYVADNQNMSVTLTFNFALAPLDLTIIEESGCLPQPAGVVINLSYP